LTSWGTEHSPGQGGGGSSVVDAEWYLRINMDVEGRLGMDGIGLE
jgi:hypothetical protein